MPARLLRTANFKLALLYAVVFSISVFLLGIIVFFSGRNSLEEQLRTRIEAEAAQLLAGYRGDGLEELQHDIKERIEANPAHRLRYSLQSPNGRVVFDRIVFPYSPGWHRMTTPKGDDLLLLTTVLDGGYLMAVAADMDGVTAIERTVRNTFLLAFVFALFLSITGGVVVSRRFLARVDRLTRAAESIGRGNLSERVPVSGAGDDFDQLAMIINRMLGRIERLVEDVRQVSTSIAHDLRTPLGKLRQKLEALQELQASSTSQALCEEALSMLDETLETFSALLRIAEMESGSFSAAFTPVDLSALLPHLVELYRPVAEEQSQELTAEIAPFLRVKGDKSLLTQLFANLIENALRHTGAGTHIHVTARQEKSVIVAQVCDDGPGIPTSERELITKPFYRLDRSRHTRGSGLGLSLAAAIAALHEASLRLEDNAPGLRISVSGVAWGSLQDCTGIAR
jgi:signal transduction histidine kinase